MQTAQNLNIDAKSVPTIAGIKSQLNDELDILESHSSRLANISDRLESIPPMESVAKNLVEPTFNMGLAADMDCLLKRVRKINGWLSSHVDKIEKFI